MFRKIGDGLRKFMAGRYGSDRLNQCLLGAAFVLILISAIGGRRGAVDVRAEFFGLYPAHLVNLPHVFAQHRSAPA